LPARGAIQLLSASTGFISRGASAILPAVPSDEVKCVYVLYGNDAFLRDTHRQEIILRVIGDSDPQTCVAAYDATAELAAVLDDLRTLPFLAPRRAVIVRDADAFVSAHRSALEKYLAAPVETACLILMVSSWPKNTRLHKVVAKIGEAIECSLPGHSNLRHWISQAAKRRGKKVAPDAAELLGEWIGRDLAGIDSELEKLSLFVDKRETITLADVSAVVTATAGPAAFALADALTTSDAGAALSALRGMMTTRGEEFRILGMVAWHLRRALQAQQMVAAGQNAEAVVRTIRMPYEKKSAFTALLKRRPLSRLQADFRRLIQADRAMKTGTDAMAALQQLVVGLCQ